MNLKLFVLAAKHRGHIKRYILLIFAYPDSVNLVI